MNIFSIKTDRLQIRNLQPKDLDGFFAYRQLPEIALYQGFNVMEKAACKAFIAKYSAKTLGSPGEWVQYAIAWNDSDEIVGDCAIRHKSPDTRIAEIGMSISPTHQKKGIAKEAMKGIVDWLFNEKEIHRIEEITDAENLAAVQLLESLGFRQEGHFIENIWFNGKWGSEYQYAILRSEWLEQQDKLL